MRAASAETVFQTLPVRAAAGFCARRVVQNAGDSYAGEDGSQFYRECLSEANALWLESVVGLPYSTASYLCNQAE